MDNQNPQASTPVSPSGAPYVPTNPPPSLEPTPEPPMPLSSSSSKKMLFIILGVVVLFSILGGGYYVMNMQKAKPTPVVQKMIPTPTTISPSPTIMASPSAMASGSAE